MSNKENQLTFIDEQGNEVLCEILFTFNSEEFNKNYVLFYPVGSEDEDGNIEVMAASYVEDEDGTCGELQDITTDEEWELIEEMLESFAGEDCDCEDCDCEECDEEEEHCCSRGICWSESGCMCQSSLLYYIAGSHASAGKPSAC